ncbi:hypothetical protein Q31b_24020 [Novipirellula aureliae]|uniref:Uncharacterized protein n=1 Tax=Novipirellula aureliae TaxID=2527966 RepID=A0A5C6E0Z0_9BACT|nr:hypothetical protein Q31b_24020 [Novipirellula aureliae]
MEKFSGAIHYRPVKIHKRLFVNTMREKLEVDDHHRIDGETVSGKIIEIGTGKMIDRIYGGAILDDCEIRILGGAKSVNLFDTTIRNCVFKTRRKLSNVHFASVHFDTCTFLGKYSGCRFGQLEAEDSGTLWSQASSLGDGLATMRPYETTTRITAAVSKQAPMTRLIMMDLGKSASAPPQIFAAAHANVTPHNPRSA